MLIKFNKIVETYGKPTGIIHIGAHLMEERDDYLSFGLDNTIWIEANPDIFSQIDYVNKKNTEEKVFNFAISDVDNINHILHVTNNGQSSSILELDRHLLHHPNIYVIETLNVTSKRMDSLIQENSIDIKKYDFINLDIQGAELLALKSFGEKLNEIKYIYTEININNLYKNCALVNEIDNFLLNFNFKRVETVMTEFEWGDALYIKKNI
jgi:FkbM family methyltransferase